MGCNIYYSSSLLPIMEEKSCNRKVVAVEQNAEGELCRIFQEICKAFTLITITYPSIYMHTREGGIKEDHNSLAQLVLTFN